MKNNINISWIDAGWGFKNNIVCRFIYDKCFGLKKITGHFFSSIVGKNMCYIVLMWVVLTHLLPQGVTYSYILIFIYLTQEWD